MIKFKNLKYLLIMILIVNQCTKKDADPINQKTFEVNKSEMEWKKILSPEEFDVLRNHGTERPFTGSLNNNKEKGVYTCSACGNPLFSSDTKFESGTGWPSFYKPVDENKVGETIDKSWGMTRVEVHCNRCGGHLGHVFEDGPKPTGLRYCINSVSLKFKKSVK